MDNDIIPDELRIDYRGIRTKAETLNVTYTPHTDSIGREVPELIEVYADKRNLKSIKPKLTSVETAAIAGALETRHYRGSKPPEIFATHLKNYNSMTLGPMR